MLRKIKVVRLVKIEEELEYHVPYELVSDREYSEWQQALDKLWNNVEDYVERHWAGDKLVGIYDKEGKFYIEE